MIKRAITSLTLALAAFAHGGQTTFDITVPVLYTGEDGLERPSRFVWTFESESGADVRWGYYADGVNRWVAPAVGDTGVRLVSLVDGEPSEVHFLHVDADPTPHSMGLLYTNAAVNAGYTYSNNNPAEDDLPDLPIVYTPGAAGAISLVASSERNTAEEGGGGTKLTSKGAINSYCVVTVVSAPPADNGANSIRPNAFGDTKHFRTWSDFDLDALVSISGSGTTDSGDLANMVVRWSHCIDVFSMQTWDGNSWEYFSEGGRAYRSHILADEYATYWADTYMANLRSLLNENTLEQKKPLLAAMLAHGQDMYCHQFETTTYRGIYASGAGQFTGMTTPIYVYAALSTDADVKNNLKWAVIDNWRMDDPNQQGPQEMRQIMRGRTGVLLWGDSHDRIKAPTTSDWEASRRYHLELYGYGAFDGSIKGSTISSAQKTAADPFGYIDGPGGGPGGYMNVTYPRVRTFSALCVLWPAFGEVVNTTDTIEYSDRLETHGIWTYPDPVAIPTVADQLASCSIWPGASTPCGDYRTGWGPTAANAWYAIEDGHGRYVSRHGEALDGYNSSWTFLGQSWADIMALYDGPRYTDRVNALGVCAAPDIYLAPSGGQLYAFMRSGTVDAIVRYETGPDAAGTPDPTESSPIFTATALAPLNMSEDTYVKAIAMKPGFADSAIASSSGQVTGGGTPPSPGGDNQPKRTRLRGSASGLLIQP